ncbi:MAG: flagellar biosynthesis protein FlhF [Candidatus Poribacteria bacterium]|nr:flagellar biosynthesis protein FlhF [Candidatus Poribacteria bacterium]
MIVRRYHGRTQEEATAAARQEMGVDVVILMAKQVPGGGVEVVAAASPSSSTDDATDFLPPRRPSTQQTTRRSTPQYDESESRSAQTPARKRPADDNPSEWMSRIRKELARDAYGSGASSSSPATKKPSAQSAPAKRLPAPQSQPQEEPVQRPARQAHAQLSSVTHLLREALRTQEVDDALLEAMLANARQDTATPTDNERNAARIVLNKAMQSFVQTSPLSEEPKGESRVIAFIGPTGVGKTTTAAKVAAHFKLRQKREVVLISADAYRIGAAAQLKGYANVLGVPFEAVMTPVDLERAIRKHGNGATILLDTPGRSPRNRKELQELSMLLGLANPAETHLVVASTTRRNDLFEIASGFYDLNPDRILFTKLDESATFGNILNFTHHLRLPLSYFTTGQTVPDAFETVTLDRIAELLLKQRRPFYV